MEGASWFLLAANSETKDGVRHRKKNYSKEPEQGDSGNSQPLYRAKHRNREN